MRIFSCPGGDYNRKSDVWSCFNHIEHQRAGLSSASLFFDLSCFGVEVGTRRSFFHWRVGRICLIEMGFSKNLLNIGGLGGFYCSFLSVTLNPQAQIEADCHVYHFKCCSEFDPGSRNDTAFFPRDLNVVHKCSEIPPFRLSREPKFHK